MLQCVGYAATSKSSKLAPFNLERHEPKENEVEIEILFCGVCHSDLHQVRNDWGNTVYPCLPGHEIVGRVVSTGGAVTGFQHGDMVGVGCMVDSCQSCPACKAGAENYCEGPNSWTATYNGPMKANGSNTFGGYSNAIVVRQEFVLRIPASIPPQQAAPILCAGVTTYSPLRHWKVGPGQRIGVAGLGGLGHMAVKLARAMGAEVVVLTNTADKTEEAVRLGAMAAFSVKDKDGMAQHAGSLDFILSTVPVPYDVNQYLPLLKRDGHLVNVGVLGPLQPPVNNMLLASKRQQVGGSLIGSIAETQEVLDFCAEHAIAPDIEVIPIASINDAFETMNKGEVRFRYVIDMASLPVTP